MTTTDRQSRIRTHSSAPTRAQLLRFPIIMSQAEIDSIKRKIEAVENVLNYRGAVKKATEKHLPAPPAINLDGDLLMYEDMSKRQLQELLLQLQELLLRGNFI